MTDWRGLTLLWCPQCRAERGGYPPPQPGDVTLCYCCLRPSVLTADGMRRLTDAELSGPPGARWLAAVRAIERARG